MSVVRSLAGLAIEQGQAVAERPYPDLVGALRCERKHVRLRFIIGGEHLGLAKTEAPGPRVPLVHAGIQCTYPEDPAAILVKRQDRIGTEARNVACIVPVTCEGAAIAVHQVQARVRADPETPCVVFEDRCDAITADAVGCIAIVPVSRKFAGIPVKKIQAAIARSDPKIALTVFENCANTIAADRLVIPGVVPKRLDATIVGIKSVQSLFGADPDCAGRILVQREDTNRAFSLGAGKREMRKRSTGRLETVEARVAKAEPECTTPVQQHGAYDVACDAVDVGGISRRGNGRGDEKDAGTVRVRTVAFLRASK